MADENETGGETGDGETKPLSEAEQRSAVINWFFAMCSELTDRGVSDRQLAIVCLSASISRLVALYGEESAAEMIRHMPEKVLSGNFSPATPDKETPPQ